MPADAGEQGHGTDERPLSFGTWPWFDVPAAGSSAKLASRGAHASAPLR